MAGLPALFHRWLETYWRRPLIAADKLPFPPARLIHTVAGTHDTAWFWQGGQLGAKALVDLLGRRGMSLGGCRTILDFGCGCGRVIRHVAEIRAGDRMRFEVPSID